MFTVVVSPGLCIITNHCPFVNIKAEHHNDNEKPLTYFVVAFRRSCDAFPFFACAGAL